MGGVRKGKRTVGAPEQSAVPSGFVPLDDGSGAAQPVKGTGGDGSHPNSVKSRFKPGNPGGPGRGKKPRTDVRFGSDPLADMRHVYAHDAGDDTTPGQRSARRLLMDDYPKFMALMAKFEDAEAARVATVAGDGWGEGAECEAAALALCERLLAEFERGASGGGT